MKNILIIFMIVVLLASVQGCTSDETILPEYAEYTVHYYLDGTATQLADDKAAIGTVGVPITEIAILIPDYTIVGSEKQYLTLAAIDNVITFYYTRNADGNGYTEDTINITTDNIDRFFGMTKDDVIRYLGNEYKEVGAGAENTYDGYYYDNYGLTFVFNSLINYEEEEVVGIEADANFDVDGARAGMDFAQIQDYLGKTEIIETWIGNLELHQIGDPDYVTFMIRYHLGKSEYSFYSLDPEGNNSWLWIGEKAEN